MSFLKTESNIIFDFHRHLKYIFTNYFKNEGFMGSFYGVCAVTQRPIQNGDDVYCLFIKNINLDNKIDITPSYTGSNWKISEFPIKAKYHDNGFIAKIHTDYEKNFNVLFDGNTIKEVHNYFRNEKLLKNKNYKYGDYAYILVYSDVIKFSEKYIEFKKEKAKENWDFFKELCLLNESPEKEFMMKWSQYSDEFEKMMNKAYDSENGADFAYTMIGALTRSLGSSNGANIEFESAQNASFQEVYELGIILHLMYGTRKEIKPQVGFGSQDYNDDNEYDIVIDVLKNFIEKREE